jgi:cysteine synthase
MAHTSFTESLAAIDVMAARPAPAVPSCTQWRYLQAAHAVTLGEGGTPLQPLHASLLLKDEGRNPNGSVQDRAASILLTAACAAGWMQVALPESSVLPGSLADALAVSVAIYGAQAGLRTHVTLSAAASEIDFLRVAAAGANRNGSTEAEAGKITSGDVARASQLAVRALAIELAEQMRWKLPETLLAPGASPLEILAYEDSFAWLREQEWVSSPHTPRCVAIHIAPESGTATAAAQVLRKMSETVGIVAEDRVRAAMETWARQGWILAPEAAAALAYCEQNAPQPGTTVVVSPRSALASAHEMARLLRIRRYPGRMPVGGIITPQ